MNEERGEFKGIPSLGKELLLLLFYAKILAILHFVLLWVVRVEEEGRVLRVCVDRGNRWGRMVNSSLAAGIDGCLNWQGNCLASYTAINEDRESEGER